MNYNAQRDLLGFVKKSQNWKLDPQLEQQLKQQNRITGSISKSP